MCFQNVVINKIKQLLMVWHYYCVTRICFFPTFKIDFYQKFDLVILSIILTMCFFQSIIENKFAWETFSMLCYVIVKSSFVLWRQIILFFSFLFLLQFFLWSRGNSYFNKQNFPRKLHANELLKWKSCSLNWFFFLQIKVA